MIQENDFNRYALEYDAWFDTNRDLFLLELDAIRALLPDGGFGLEVGAGTGRFASELGIDHGVEPSETMTAIAKRRGVNVTVGVAEILPFGNERFDFVLFVASLCFVRDPDAALKEARRVLKRDGKLIVAILDKTHIKGKEGKRFYRDARLYTPEEVIGLMEQHGFRYHASRQTLLPPPNKERIKEGYGEGKFVALQGIKTEIKN